jgi:hypothetical protein
LAGSAFIFLLLVLVTPTSDYFQFRYVEAFKVLSDEQPEEGGINARLIGYEESLKIIEENPVLGVGIGGFKNYKENKTLDIIKYPHNIFLEFQAELGILGTIFFLLFLYRTAITLYRINIYLLIVWLYTIWLALFAKDISANLLVFIPLIFYGRPYETERLKEFFAPSRNGSVLSGKSSSISE